MNHKSIPIGILSYAAYIPKYRIKIEDICRVWGKKPEDVINTLGVFEKSVASIDEDAVTMAVDAASSSLTRENAADNIDIVFVGSESHPYAVNPTSTIIGEMLGLGNNYLAADLEFACKAATAGMQTGIGLIEAGRYNSALVIGTDRAQSKPHDPLEYTASSASTAFVLGKGGNVIAEITEMSSFSSDTPDFWRRDGIKYPSHGGRFTGEPGYFKHVQGAAETLLKKSGNKPSDFTYCVFHMPNGKFPRRIAKNLGFTEKQLNPSLVVEKIGNPYSASSLIGLAAILDIAKPDELIFMISYGSGAGADGFIIEVTENILDYQERQRETVKKQIEKKEYISYVQYLKMSGKI